MGIKQGDIVKVTGTKSTGAVCLEIDDSLKVYNDPEIIYTSKSGILPQARVSDLVLTNIGSVGQGLAPIEIQKIPYTVAKSVTLIPLEFDEKKFEKARLEGLVVCKNDRIYFHDQNLGFFVDCVEPNDYAIITKDTKIEFQKKAVPQFQIPKITKLKKVIPIVKNISEEFVDIVIPSLEAYDDGCRFYVYLKGRYGNNIKFSGGHTSLNGTTLQDNLGNLYDIFSFGGGGSSSQDEFSFDFSFISGPINQKAKELTITIKEISIQSTLVCPPSSGSEMRDFRYSPNNPSPSFLIISGPWQATVKME